MKSQSAQKEAKNKAAVVMYLPHDIVHDILLKLPIKSLLRFKTVCKSWRSLISDPQFAKSHLDLPTNHKVRNVNYLPILEPLKNQFPFNNNQPLSVTSITTSKEEATSIITTLELDNPMLNDDYLLGSCNGMLLVAHESDTFLWNPSIGECRTMLATNNFQFSHIFGQCVSGLGYCSSLDEYKGVVFDKYDRYMFLFTSKTGYWAKFNFIDNHHESFPSHGLCSNPVGLTVNGNPYWMVRDDDGNNPDLIKIIYFDMVCHKFYKVAPPASSLWTSWSTSITILKECLCVVDNSERPRVGAIIWIMEKYGVNESWKKLFVIKDSFYDLRPLRFTKTEHEVVMVIHDKFVIYNVKTDRKRHIVTGNEIHPFRFYDAGASYVESLVSPKSVMGMNRLSGHSGGTEKNQGKINRRTIML